MPEAALPHPALARARWLEAPATRAVVAALTRDGRPLRFVGGVVRDTLLDPTIEPQDFDLATPEPPEAVLDHLRRAGLRAVPTGLAHGTVTAVPDDRHRFEITTLRRDVACDGRRAVVEFSDDFTADAARRDFTINALSCDADGRLFDPFGGLADLAARRVRFVGAPAQRIAEDYLRILRFFRFNAQLGHPPMDAAALAACAALAGGLVGLSGERLWQELARILVARGAVPAVAQMLATGVLGRLVRGPWRFATFRRLRALHPTGDALLSLSALLAKGPAADAEAARIARRLRLSTREGDRLAFLATTSLPEPAGDAAAHRRYAYRYGADRYGDLLHLAAADAEPAPSIDAALAIAATWVPPRLPVGGDDLIARGIPPGPARGRLLEQVRTWWIATDFTADRAACLAELDRLIAHHGANLDIAGPTP